MLLKYGLAGLAGAGGFNILYSVLVQRRLTPAARIFLSLFAALVFLGLDMFYIEPNWIEVHTVRIQDPELAAIIGETKIVQISDIHLTEGIGFRERQLIEKVNRLKPDLIFITGDFLDDLSQAEPARKLIGSLRANLGIFGVPGNTDHIVMDGNTLKRELAPAGIDILVNESRQIRMPNGHFFRLVGSDDPKYGFARLDPALRSIPQEAPILLLAHAPGIFEKAFRERINLVLVGDTHGGQVGIPFLVRLSAYAGRTPYMKGLFVKGGTKMYVNRGIGMKTLPIRFLCRPEITVLEVRP